VVSVRPAIIEAEVVSVVPSPPLPIPSSSSFSMTVVPSAASRSIIVSREVAPAFWVPPLSASIHTLAPAGAVKV
jgi:hypothetical protein